MACGCPCSGNGEKHSKGCEKTQQNKSCKQTARSDGNKTVAQKAPPPSFIEGREQNASVFILWAEQTVMPFPGRLAACVAAVNLLIAVLALDDLPVCVRTQLRMRQSHGLPTQPSATERSRERLREVERLRERSKEKSRCRDTHTYTHTHIVVVIAYVASASADSRLLKHCEHATKPHFLFQAN